MLQKRASLGVDFQCRVIITCVNFTSENKKEAMHERSLVSVKLEPRSTSRLRSPFYLACFFIYVIKINFTCVNVPSQKYVSGNQPLGEDLDLLYPPKTYGIQFQRWYFRLVNIRKIRPMVTRSYSIIWYFTWIADSIVSRRPKMNRENSFWINYICSPRRTWHATIYP